LILDHHDFHLLVDDVSFLHPHLHFRLSVADKYQFHHDGMLEEVIMVQVVKKSDTSLAFE
jgi:hypothetical protein